MWRHNDGAYSQLAAPSPCKQRYPMQLPVISDILGNFQQAGPLGINFGRVCAVWTNFLQAVLFPSYVALSS